MQLVYGKYEALASILLELQAVLRMLLNAFQIQPIEHYEASKHYNSSSCSVKQALIYKQVTGLFQSRFFPFMGSQN